MRKDIFALLCIMLAASLLPNLRKSLIAYLNEPARHAQVEAPALPPPVDFLDLPEADMDRSSSCFHYGQTLRALFHGDFFTTTGSRNLQYIATARMYRQDCVPYILPCRSETMTLEEQRKELAIVWKEIEEFWKPWLTIYWGSEGAYYRERAKDLGLSVNNPPNFNDVKYNYPGVDEFIKKAADLGDPEGLYLHGIVRFKDSTEYFPDAKKEGWPSILRAADAGYAPAAFVVARAYLDKKLFPRNIALARKYMEIAATNGKPDGYEFAVLSECYATGTGDVPQDPIKAYMYAAVADIFLGGRFYLPPRARSLELTPEEQQEAEYAASAYAEKHRERVKQQKEADEARWKAMVPAIKEDIRKRAPWMIWTMAPHEEFIKARKAYLLSIGRDPNTDITINPALAVPKPETNGTAPNATKP